LALLPVTFDLLADEHANGAFTDDDNIVEFSVNLDFSRPIAANDVYRCARITLNRWAADPSTVFVTDALISAVELYSAVLSPVVA